ncbi:hypothetical protein C4559_03795 [Candidatus Microgenomates bacterium]|nr:MAG: hypothetical protein C4559_03795 [Candidatus Microgenomates bacterium]
MFFSVKKYFLLFFLLFSLLSVSFFSKTIFAAWGNDVEPPSTTIAVFGTGCLTNGNTTGCSGTTNPTASLSCSDNVAGCDTTYWQILTTGSCPAPANPPPASYTLYNSNPITINSSTGNQTICAYSVDLKGNIESPAKIHTVNFNYSVSGNVFIDTNKDGIKNTTPSESNYTQNALTIDAHSGNSCSGALITNVQTNAATGTFNSGATLPSGNYTFCFPNSSLPSGYSLTTNPSFPVTIGASCSAPNPAVCSNGNITNLNFGLSSSSPWFQCTGGDCLPDNPPPIPDTTCGTNQNYASVSNSISLTPGVLFFGDNPYSFCSGGVCQDRASTTQWVVGGPTYGRPFTPARPGIMRTSYESYTTLARQNNITPTPLSTTQCGAGNIASCSLSSSLVNGVYISNGSLTLMGTGNPPTYTFPANRNFVILINGDLNINTNIIVPISSTVTFSASGDIVVASNIGVASSSLICNPTTHANCNLEGFYSAGRNMVIQGNGATSCGSGTPDLRLNVAGSIVVNAGLNGGNIVNQRDLCSNECPSISITERPDFVVNAPEFVKIPTFVWQEVAP